MLQAEEQEELSVGGWTLKLSGAVMESCVLMSTTDN